jgi:hypothetical protein
MADQPKSKMDMGLEETLKKQREKEAAIEKNKELLGSGTARLTAETIIKRKKDYEDAMKE